MRFLDRAGNYHTDGLHVVERIRRTDADHLSYEATIEDPNVYTRPWTISMPLYRRVEPNMQLGEFKCEEFVSDLVYGKYQKGTGTMNRRLVLVAAGLVVSSRGRRGAAACARR